MKITIMEIVNNDSGYPHDTGYPHDGRADNAVIGTTVVKISGVIRTTGKSTSKC